MHPGDATGSAGEGLGGAGQSGEPGGAGRGSVGVGDVSPGCHLERLLHLGLFVSLFSCYSCLLVNLYLKLYWCFASSGH